LLIASSGGRNRTSHRKRLPVQVIDEQTEEQQDGNRPAESALAVFEGT